MHFLEYHCASSRQGDGLVVGGSRDEENEKERDRELRETIIFPL